MGPTYFFWETFDALAANNPDQALRQNIIGRHSPAYSLRMAFLDDDHSKLFIRGLHLRNWNIVDLARADRRKRRLDSIRGATGDHL